DRERSSPVRAPKLPRGCGKVKRVGRPELMRVFGRPRAHALTSFAALSYLLKLVFERGKMTRAGTHEADIQASQPQAGQQARVSRPHGHARWAQGPEPSAPARPRAADRQDRRQVGAGPTPPRRESLPRDARVARGAEIRALLERGKRERTRNLDVFVGASPASRSRLGLVVPKHGRRIVERNRLKRRLREIGRRHVLPALEERGEPTDLLVRARRSAYEVEYDTLKRELLEALEAAWPGRS